MTNNLYICKELYLLIFEERLGAEKAWLRDAEAFTEPPDVNLWSGNLKCKVIGHTNPREIVMLLKREGQFWRVLAGEKVGWIVGGIGNGWVERIEEI